MPRRTLNKVRAKDGLNVLAYIGVNAYSPPTVYMQDRPPTSNDCKNYILGDLWIVNVDNDRVANPPQFWFLWALPTGFATWIRLANDADVAKQITTLNDGNVALPLAGNWNFEGLGQISVLTPVDGAENITFSLAGSGFTEEYVTDDGSAIPAAGILNVLGGDNINTAAIADLSNNLYVNLDKSIHLPNTNAVGDQGAIFKGATGFPLAGGTIWIHNRGTANTFIGENSGTLTLNLGSAVNNTGIGADTLATITTGSENFAGGKSALESLEDGQDNTAVGVAAGGNLVSGNRNTLLGESAGQALTTNESDNIYIAQQGVITESNTIRIGASGTGNFEQSRAFMGGIYDVTPASSTIEYVVVSDDDQLGSTGIAPGGGGIKVTEFFTSDTWTKDLAGPKWIKVIGWNGGGGGASGQALNLASPNTLNSANGGGGGGGAFIYEGPANFFGATETVIVGAGGAGGAAVNYTSGSNGGIAGGAGGISYFGYLNSPTVATGGLAPGGFGNAGGGGTSGKIYTYGFNSGIQQGTQGGAGGSATPPPVHKPDPMGTSANKFLMATAGGGGGSSATGITVGQASGSEGGDFLAPDDTTVILAGGALGLGSTTGNGANGGNGNDGYGSALTNFIVGGTGGGGGGGSSVLAATVGNGGNGGFPGGGGGGGAGSSGKFAADPAIFSGAGGDGGDGFVVVYEYF